MAHDVLFWYDDRMRSFKLYLKGRQRPTSFPRTVWASLFYIADLMWPGAFGWRQMATPRMPMYSLPWKSKTCRNHSIAAASRDTLFFRREVPHKGAYAAPRGRQQLRETAVKGRCSAQNSAEITPGALVTA